MLFTRQSLWRFPGSSELQPSGHFGERVVEGFPVPFTTSLTSTGDGDFSCARFRQAYESELAGQLGNLVHRVLSMVEHYCSGSIPAAPDDFAKTDRLLRTAKQLPKNVASHLHAFAFDRALDDIWTFVADANRYVAEEAPWDLAKAAALHDQAIASASAARLHGTLFCLSASLHTIAKCITPPLQEIARKLFQKLGEADNSGDQALAGRRIEVGVPLFPKA